MSHSGSSGIGPPVGETGRAHYQQYQQSGPYHSGDGSGRQHARSPAVEHHQQQYYGSHSSGEREQARRTVSGKYPEEYKKTDREKQRQGSHSSQSSSRHSQSDERSAQSQPYAPTTGQMRSGHLELDSLYSGNAGPVEVNSMNAPNNSTVQCGCENIDCPFCNLMLSVQMSK